MKRGPNDENQGIYTGDWKDWAVALLLDSTDDIAMVFVDPPYEVGFEYGSGKSDNEMPPVKPFDLYNVGRQIAPVVLITPGIANLWRYPEPSWVMSWHKPGSQGRSGKALAGFNTWEPILVYGTAKKRVWQDSINLPSVANLNNKDANFHGCPKPMTLMRWLILQFTDEGDTVLDFMVGSGTTAIAAKETGRRWLGFEIDPSVAERARTRVRNAPVPLPGIYTEQAALL